MSEKDEKLSSKVDNIIPSTHTTRRQTSDELGTQKKQQSKQVVDDPCWGGSQEHQHNLSALLHVISSGKFPPVGGRSDNIIIHNSDDFVVIDKPPDLRMDGPYPATVHKLTTYWFPPASLIHTVLAKEQSEHGHDNNDNEDNDNDKGDKKDDVNDTDGKIENIQTKYKHNLLQEISKLDNHGSLSDNIIRTTHQLDYATSGVLLMAKSRRAAATACAAFANRSTRKEYLSIVHHNVDAHSEFKVLDGDEEGLFRSWMDGSLENEHRKMRRHLHNRKGQTFIGYLPNHSVFAKWKGTRQKRRKRKRIDSASGDSDAQGKMAGNPTNGTTHASGKEDKVECKTESQQKRDHGPGKAQANANAISKSESILLKPLKDINKEEEERLIDLSWKEIKQNPKHKAIFHDLTKSYNEALKQQQDTEKQEKSESNKSVTKSDSSSVPEKIKLPTFFRIQGESEDAFYIHAALADDPTTFRVHVNPDAITECSPDIQSVYGRPRKLDGKDLTFKPSLTRCVVLKRGFWNGRPVTKMLLQPRTGRRHQLRLHMAILGSPILGDCTYAAENAGTESTECDRMCLHAHKLTIPLGEKKMKVFVAPDPFVGLI